MSRRTIVTGGASLIGSHVVEELLKRGDNVIVLDNLSSGTFEWLRGVQRDIQFVGTDLRESGLESIRTLFKGVDVVYHLAADHGGRGYVDYRMLNTSNNFVIDSNVFSASRDAGVEKIIFASSGCIYPLYLQRDVSERIYLREEDDGREVVIEEEEEGGVGGEGKIRKQRVERRGYQPDGLYGLAKLTAELTLRRLYEETGIKSASCRFFTVYGPRAKENHAIIAMIARTFIRQAPFEVWGDGTQIRNWTYVEDISKGMVASEELADKKGCDVINLGTMERVSVKEAVEYIISLSNYYPQLKFLPDKPTGPLNRVADNSRMVSELGIEPLPLRLGVKKTFDWYYETHDRGYVEKNLERLLVERK